MNPASVARRSSRSRCHAAPHEPSGRRRSDAAPRQEGVREAADRGPGTAGRTCACCSAARSARRSSGPRCAWCSRAGTPRARAGRSSGWSASSTRGTCGSPQFAAPTLRREAAPLPVAVLAGAARLGRDGRARPQLVRAGAGRAGRGVRHRGALAAGLRRDRRPRGDARRRGHDPGQVLDARLAGGAAPPVREAPRRPATRRGSSPTRTGATARSGRSTRPRSRTCWPAPITRPAPWHVVAAEDKRLGARHVVRTVCEAMEQAHRRPRHRPRPAAGARASSPVPGRRAGGSRRASRCRPPPRR